MALIAESWNTDANLNTALPPMGAPEGMLAGQVDDVLRKVMAGTREVLDANIFRDGGTVGGTANAITLTTAVVLPPAYALSQTFSFVPTTTNTGSATLNVNGLGAVPIKYRGADLLQGDLAAGSPAIVVFDGTNFQLVRPSRPRAIFKAWLTGDTTYSANVLTKIGAQNVSPSIGGYYSTSTFRWTPPAGVVWLYAQLAHRLVASNRAQLIIYRDGTTPIVSRNFYAAPDGLDQIEPVSTFDLTDGTHYYEAYVLCTTSTIFVRRLGQYATMFSGEALL